MNETVDEINIPIGEPIELYAIAVKKAAIKCKIVATKQPITLRKVRGEVEGEIITVLPTRVWRHYKTQYMSGDIIAARIDIPALQLQPLAVYERGIWDPEREYWGEPDEPMDDCFKPIIEFGPRKYHEMEQIIPLEDPDDPFEDPITDAAQCHQNGEEEEAYKIIEKVLTEDIRCIDAHAHLGNWNFNRHKGDTPHWSLNSAKRHYEVGVKIAELSLGEKFNGVLPWGCIDNRPYLRCMHGYGLSLWRLEQREEAREVFKKMLWLNPSDNQGIRFLLARIESGLEWVDGG